VLTLIRIVLLIAFLVALIRLRLNLALALIIDSICAGILFRMKLLALVKAFPLTLTQTTTLEFLGIIYLVLLLGEILQATGSLTRVIQSLEKLFKDYRVSIAVIPALIGLLPMPAGAMLSAPLVKECGVQRKLSAEIMTHINFWFRHVWEYFWPLYQGILLTAAILKVSIRDIMITQAPLSLFAIGAGIFFMLRIPGERESKGRTDLKQVGRVFFYMWPVLLVILLVLIIKMRMVYALGISALGALALSGIRLRPMAGLFKQSFSISTLGVIYSVFLFKNITELSGALKLMPAISSGPAIVKLAAIFIAPFLVGFLTGVNSAFVGITFPVIAPLMTGSGVNLSYVMFAYAGGFAGVLLSPIHLCLCLTKEYYGAEYPKVYRYLLPSVLFMLAGSVLLLLLYNLN
jgi:integral membrane protein (TIGR00529 family)